MSGTKPAEGGSLRELLPALAAEWHPSKNGSLSDADVKPFSQKKVWWQCSLGHEWQSTVGNRAQGRGCPVCAGKVILTGFNDLATIRPDIAAEWHPTRNGHLSASVVGLGTRQKVWWKCPVAPDHEWEASIVNRTTPSVETGCAVCAGRVVVPSTSLEVQFPSVAAEWHPTKNGELTAATTTSFVTRKAWWRCSKDHEWHAAISSRTKGKTGCPKCAGKVSIPGETDLTSTHPEIASEWHPTKNRELTPASVKSRTNKPVWWQCSKGHEWKVSPDNRTGQMSGCPFCAGQRAIVGVNDLATTHPDLASQWHPTKNGKRQPTDVMAGTSKKVWWKCSKDHEWAAPPSSRSQGIGCPICANKKVLAGYNDLQTTNPDLVSEWNYEKNGAKTPQHFTMWSGKKVWWRCEQDHEWMSTVANRSMGQGCPSCARSGFNPSKEGWLYFLRHSNWSMFQIGISNVIEERLRRHFSNGWELIEVRGPMDGAVTAALERSALNALKARGARLGKRGDLGQFDGYTESWPMSTLIVESIKQILGWVYEDDKSIGSPA
jgi:hypothetical protein